MKKEYTNGEITVVWQPDLCIHSRICWTRSTGLPEVFNPGVKPWINLSNSDSASIVEQVKKCPSGALSVYYTNSADETKPLDATVVMETIPNGPVLLKGAFKLKTGENEKLIAGPVTAFCRCGASSNKPFCDGSHMKIGFKTE